LLVPLSLSPQVDGGFDLDESSRQDLDEFGVPLGDDEDDLFDEGGEGDQVAAAVEEEEEEDARLDDLEALQVGGWVGGSVVDSGHVCLVAELHVAPGPRLDIPLLCSHTIRQLCLPGQLLTAFGRCQR
jgi:hypothetical protein